MKRSVFLILLLAIPVFACSVLAADKVVVVPMNTDKAAGTDGQIQYNDGGKTGGANVFYNKATGNLFMGAEFRTTDPSGNNRLWGKGRPGIGLITHTDPNEYCTTGSGIMYALSTTLVSWDGAASACPQGTWVCVQNELPASGACDIESFMAIGYIDCQGNEVNTGMATALNGWISDGYNNEGTLIPSDDFSASLQQPTCEYYRVWCCRE